MFSILFLCLFIITQTSSENKIKLNKIKHNLKKEPIGRILQEETDYEDPPIIYNITIVNCTIVNGYFDLSITPILLENITFLAKLAIDMINSPLRGLADNEVYIPNIAYNRTRGNYSAFSSLLYSDDPNVIMNVTILNISAVSNDYSILFNINFEGVKPIFLGASNGEMSQTDTSNNDTTGNSNGNYAIGGGGGKSTSSVSIGLIIGIIAAAVAVIGIIIGVIIYFKKRKKKEDLSVTNIPLTEPKEDVRTLVLTTQKQDKKTIVIKANQNMKDLRKMFFEAINQPELVEEKSILFLFNGKGFNSNSKELIKDIFKNNNGCNIVIIADSEDKIIE